MISDELLSPSERMTRSRGSNSECPAIDEVDRPPSDYTVKNRDIAGLLFSIICHIVDVGLDIYLAYRYYNNGEINYFIWTSVFIFFPAFVNTVVSISMYVQDNDQSDEHVVWRLITGVKPLRLLVLVFQLASTLRYCESLCYALASRRAQRVADRAEQKRYYELMLKEDSDVALLRVFECFLEAAPQQILQITIMLYSRDGPSQLVPQFLAISSSLVSMAWCIASYHRCIRFVQTDKNNMSWQGTAMQFLWHFLITVSRILSIATIASLFPLWTLLGCGIHSVVMTLWIFLFDRCPFWSHNLCYSFMFSAILGVVFVFTYIIPKEGRTIKRYIVYYPLCFIENTVCTVLFVLYVSSDIRDTWYFLPLVVLSVLPFIFGIMFMVFYYMYFHPKYTPDKCMEIQDIT